MTKLTRKNEERRWGGGFKKFYGNHAIIELTGEKTRKPERDRDEPLMRTKASRSVPRERLISNYAGREYSNQMPWEWND